MCDRSARTWKTRTPPPFPESEGTGRSSGGPTTPTLQAGAGGSGQGGVGAVGISTLQFTPSPR